VKGIEQLIGQMATRLATRDAAFGWLV